MLRSSFNLFAFILFCFVFDADFGEELDIKRGEKWFNTSQTASNVTLLPSGPWICKSGMFLETVEEN